MISTEEFAAIAELDLESIKFKLTHKKAGTAWTIERANAVEIEYRRFLYLMKMFPNVPAAPTVDVDTFWHQHILDTVKYAADCERIFGYFLHHFPYLGMRGNDDEQALIRSAVRMAELYEATFGERYPGTGANENPLRPALSLGVHSSKLPAAGAEPAYCIKSSAGNTQPAYCIKVNDATASAAIGNQPAYCIKAHESPDDEACNRQAAFCVRACGFPEEAATNEADADLAVADAPMSRLFRDRRHFAPEFNPGFYSQRPRLPSA